MLGTKIKFDKSVIYTSAINTPFAGNPDETATIQSKTESLAALEASNIAKKHKIDEDVSEIGADFSEKRCFSWWKDENFAKNYSVLDSWSGLEVADDDSVREESPLSSCRLQSSFLHITRLLKRVSEEDRDLTVNEAEKYMQNKKDFSSPSYQLAKNEIQTKKNYFYNWKI